MSEKRLYLTISEGTPHGPTKPVVVSNDQELIREIAPIIARKIGLDSDVARQLGATELAEPSYPGPQLVPNESPAASLARQEQERRQREAERERDPRDRAGWALLLRHEGKVVARTDLKALLLAFAPRLAAGEPGPESAVAELDFGRRAAGIGYADGSTGFQPSYWKSHHGTSNRDILRDFLRAYLAEEELATEEQREAVEAALAALEREGGTDVEA